MPAGMVDPEIQSIHSARDDGDRRLAELGYAQELKRGWGVMENIGVSFSIISVITGITTLFEFGLTTGGPGVMSVGWICVTTLTMSVALSMAEIVSAVPTSGGPYHWAALITKHQHSAFAAWITGWFNLLGQVAVTTGISFGCAGLISTLATVKGYEATAPRTIGIYAALLVSHGLVNTFGIKLLGLFNKISIVIQGLGVTALCIALLAKAPTHRSAREVFGFYYDGTGVDAPGWGERASPAWVAACGALLTQYTITGYDASAHMSEETHNAARSAPIGVITSVGASAVFGFFVLLSFLFSIQDFDRTVNSDYAQPVLQIFLDVFGENGAIGAFAFVIICVWHAGLFSITANSRMFYAFARDGGLPQFFNHVDGKMCSPIRTVWLAVILAFILALPSLGSSVAFAAATSIATVGLYISYTIPIFILLVEHDRFKQIQGPWNLGPFSRPVALIAVLWVSAVTVIFCLPTVNPVNSQTINYTVVAVGIVAMWAFGSWALWARKWFKGPRQAALEEVAQDPNTTLAARLSIASEDKGDASRLREGMVRPVDEKEKLE